MENYKSNSHKSKEEQKRRTPEKKVQKVVTGTVKTKKKSEVRKFADVLVSEDIEHVKSYIWMDVLIPTIKNTIAEIVKNSVDMILFGETRKSNKRPSASKVSYNRYYEEPNGRREYSAKARTGFDYDDIVFDNRADAESVLDAMNDIIEQFNIVSVADLYDLADVSTTNYATNKYGWTDISGAKAVRLSNGDYMLKLPRALPID